MWNSIYEGVQSYRIKSGINNGLYSNPIINNVYLRESAFSCNVMKVQYLKTNDSRCNDELQQTLSAISNKFNISGLSCLSEPIIGTRFYKMKSGSLPAAIILIHALDISDCVVNFAIIKK